jgi:hypothetical protein
MKPARRWIWILWPGFIVAIPAVGVVFTLVDPEDLHWGGMPLAVSRMAAYTLGFFFFWALGAASSALTGLLQRPARELNRCPLTPRERPEGCPKRSLPEKLPR